MTRPLWLLLLLAAPLWAGIPGMPQNVKSLYGRETLEIVQHPDSVSACLLKQSSKGKLTERTRRIQLPENASKEVSAILSNDETYGWDYMKPCLPEYGARLIFKRGAEEVIFDFCFECKVFSFTSKTKGGDEDFDAAREPLLKLFKTAFPGDRLIQKAE